MTAKNNETEINERYNNSPGNWINAFQWLNQHKALGEGNNLFEETFHTTVQPQPDNHRKAIVTIETKPAYGNTHHGEHVSVTTPFGLEATIVELARTINRLYTLEGERKETDESTHVVVEDIK